MGWDGMGDPEEVQDPDKGEGQGVRGPGQDLNQGQRRSSYHGTTRPGRDSDPGFGIRDPNPPNLCQGQSQGHGQSGSESEYGSESVRDGMGWESRNEFRSESKYRSEFMLESGPDQSPGRSRRKGSE